MNANKNRFEKTSKKVTGKPLRVNNRTLIPIVEMTYLTRNQEKDLTLENLKFLGLLISPLAFVLVEDDREWVLPIQNEKIHLEQLIEVIPTLENEILEARKL